MSNSLQLPGPLSLEILSIYAGCEPPPPQKTAETDEPH